MRHRHLWGCFFYIPTGFEPPDCCNLLPRYISVATCLYFISHSASHTLSYRIDGNFVIKVADFGLSRDIYSRNYYHGGRGEKVPARWMPVEALVDGLWTEKSDVVTCNFSCHFMILLPLLLLFYLSSPVGIWSNLLGDLHIWLHSLPRSGCVLHCSVSEEWSSTDKTHYLLSRSVC